MANSLQVETTLQPRGPAAAIVLTDEQVAEVGGGAKTFPVTVGVRGQTLRLRLARMGGENLIGLNRAVREQAGLEIGQHLTVEIARDDAPRPIDLPDELLVALTADPAAKAAFDALAPSHRKEYATWVAQAKREQTRADRVATTVERVKQGLTR